MTQITGYYVSVRQKRRKPSPGAHVTNTPESPHNQPDVEAELASRGLVPTSPAGATATRAFAEAGTATHDRARGAMLGAAIGDALGCPVEGLTPEQIRAHHGEIREFRLPASARDLRVGSYGGDTKLMLQTAEALLEADQTHPAAFAARMIRGIRSRRNVANAAREAVIRLSDGRPWHRAGMPSAGDGAIVRATAVGLRHVTDLEALRTAAARNTVVTHADRLAVAAGMVHAYAVARLARTDIATLDPAAFLDELADALGADFADVSGVERRTDRDLGQVRLADRIREVGGLLDTPWAEAMAHIHNGAYVLEALPAALWFFLAHRHDPAEAIARAVNAGFDADTVAALTGSLAGALHGADALPAHLRDEVEAGKRIGELGRRLVDAAAGTPRPASATPTSANDAERVHVTVLLDRSGSMGSVADDTIGGFNTFLDEQRQLPGECRVTLVQFDGQDPQEVVLDAAPIAGAANLDADTYRPRGSTPLLDAVGAVVDRIDARVAADPDEFQLVAIITDGYENASQRRTGEEIRELVRSRSDDGWAFVFLGANVDAFDEARKLGLEASQAADFSHDAEGVTESFYAVSRSAAHLRRLPGRAAKIRAKDVLLDEVRREREAEGRL